MDSGALGSELIPVGEEDVCYWDSCVLTGEERICHSQEAPRASGPQVYR
jgi:hypothetical protein